MFLTINNHSIIIAAEKIKSKCLGYDQPIFKYLLIVYQLSFFFFWKKLPIRVSLLYLLLNLLVSYNWEQFQYLFNDTDILEWPGQTYRVPTTWIHLTDCFHLDFLLLVSFIFYSYKLEVRYKEIMSFRLKMLNMEIL